MLLLLWVALGSFALFQTKVVFQHTTAVPPNCNYISFDFLRGWKHLMERYNINGCHWMEKIFFLQSKYQKHYISLLQHVSVNCRICSSFSKTALYSVYIYCHTVLESVYTTLKWKIYTSPLKFNDIHLEYPIGE